MLIEIVQDQACVIGRAFGLIVMKIAKDNDYEQLSAILYY